MTTDQTPAPAEAPECDICADGQTECTSCDGSGDDGCGYVCRTCGGSGAAVPDHCCGCGGSPYCACCPTCGAACVGDCSCPITLTLTDGRTHTL